MSVPARKPSAATGRIPANIIRAVRRFHSLDQVALAEAFQVAVRTVIRWEQRGMHPDLLPEDPGAKAGPKWRKTLWFWMHGRYCATASPDNTKNQGESA